MCYISYTVEWEITTNNYVTVTSINIFCVCWVY